jgi:XTP/dITP diphosphohydrolase
LLLNSGNANKLRELRAALPEWEIELLDTPDEPVEDGATFVDNARIKARHGRLRAPRDAWVAGEDSGIEVAGPGRAPGSRVRTLGDGRGRDSSSRSSARPRIGAHGTYASWSLLGPDAAEIRATGTLEGEVAAERRGDEGFGYDPIFVPLGEARTVAELGNVWKSEHSHRARAAFALARLLAER